MPYADHAKQKEYQREWHKRKMNDPEYRERIDYYNAIRCRDTETARDFIRKYYRQYGSEAEAALINRLIELEGVGHHERSKKKKRVQGTHFRDAKKRIVEYISELQRRGHWQAGDGKYLKSYTPDCAGRESASELPQRVRRKCVLRKGHALRKKSDARDLALSDGAGSNARTTEVKQ